MRNQKGREGGPTSGQARRARRRSLNAARQRLRALDLPPISSMESLVDVIAQRQGRPIQLQPRALIPEEASAYCEQRPDCDVIVYDSATSAFHQRQLICHELAHLLCEHKPTKPVAEDSVLRARLPHIDPTVIRLVLGRSFRLLGRTVYDDPAEREAETLGTLLQQVIPEFYESGITARILPALEHRPGGEHV